MKNSSFGKIIFCLFAAVLSVTLLFTACARRDKEIPVPTDLAITNDVLTWTAVPGTLTYDVKVDETVYSTQSTRFPLPITDYEFHTVTVRANTLDGSGEYATALTYKRHARQNVLPVLSSPVISMTSSRVLWSTVLNNNGYLIYMGDTVFTAEKNATYYDLDFPADGTYYIRMQTLGDGISYTNSKISNAYAVTVKGGKAPLQKLPKAEFSFDAGSKSLVWTNRYSAAAVSYEIYQEGVDLPIETIPADATKVKMTYKPELKGGRVGYSMRLISNNGLYNPSDFNSMVSFPIADAAPTALSVSPKSDRGTFVAEWLPVVYCDGYILEIDGTTYDVGDELSMPIPGGLLAGRHVVRVKSKGLGVYYADSLYSEGVVFYVDDKGALIEPLSAPQSPTLLLTEEGVLSVSVRAVEGAARYRFTFIGASGESTLISETEAFDLSDGRFGERRATDAERAIIASIFADLPSGVRVSAVAIPGDPLYVESPRSRESFFSTQADVPHLSAPDLSYGENGLTWSNLGDEVEYEICLDGETYDVTAPITPAAGSHRARVRAKGDNALWSAEVLFRTPVDLDVPTALSLSGSVLSFTGSKGATSYRLIANGEVTATFTTSDGRINLNNYFTVDGEYVLSLVAAGGSGYADSAPSRQILYVKDDAAYGTALKPYLPIGAAALWRAMRDDPSAYFRLSAGGVYDFTDYDFSAESSFVFKGTLMGSGATLKGLRVGSPLFEALDGATIRDLTIEAEAKDFAFSQNGIFAKSLRSTLLFGVTISLSGQAELSSDATFGALCYEAKELTIRDSAIRCGLSVESTQKLSFGVIAADFSGVLSGVSISGEVSLGGKDVRCGVLSATGSADLTEYYSSLALTVNATDNVTLGGISVEGAVRGTRVTTVNAISANAAYVTYYGVSDRAVTLLNGEASGTVSAQGSSVKMFGLAQGGTISLSDVKVKTALKGKATSEMAVAGVAETLASGAVTEKLSFEGEIEANAPKMDLAGIAMIAEGPYEARSGGTVTATGRSARITLGAMTSADAAIESAGTIEMTKVAQAEVGGAALTSSGRIAVSGTLDLTAEECGEVRFGGAVATGDQAVEVGAYLIRGGIEADLVRFGGASYDAGAVSFSSSALALDVSVTSDDIQAAGAYLSAASLSFTAPSALATQLKGVGTGELGGFGGQIGSVRFEDLSVSGLLSLQGSGALYGVADDVGEASKVASSVSLFAEGDVEVYGLFRSVGAASDLALSSAEISLKSDHPFYHGILGTVRDGAIGGVTISDVSFRAEPLSPMGAAATVYGLTETVRVLEGVAVAGCSYHLGAYEEVTFCGLTDALEERIGSSALSYELHSDATDTSIGGAFGTAAGELDLIMGTQAAPVTITVNGRVRCGGLVLEPRDLTWTGGASIDLHLNSLSGDSTAGGLFAEIGGSRTVTISDATAEVSLTRSGEGALTFGGSAAICSGTLIGAKNVTTARGGVSDDVYGGVIGALSTGRLANASARGVLSSAGTVGGLVGVVTYGYLEGGESAAEISSSGIAGGVFAQSIGGRVQNVASVSRLTDKGAGLFAEAENTTFLNAYFAGTSADYALAKRAVNVGATSLYLDASLSTVPAVEEGDLDYEVRSLGYGCRDVELGDAFVQDGKRYPYVRAIGPFAEVATVSSRSLPSITITEATDLYDVLPRYYDAATPTITWVDDSSLLTIRDGVATVSDNGNGTLYGVLSGGARVYSVFYTADGFVPLVGEGTAESPYLIRDMQYYHYVKEYAEGFATAHFRFDLSEDTVEGAEFPALFGEETPFCGTIDFAGVRFLSPSLPENGILGCLNGATVKGLCLGGDLGGTLLASAAVNSTIEEIELDDFFPSGDIRLVGSAEASRLVGVIVRGNGGSAIDFALVDDLVDGTIEDVSIYLSVNTSENASLSVIGRSVASEITRVQALWRVKMVGGLSSSLVRTDEGSVFNSCMALTDAREVEAAEQPIAGLALVANGSTFDGCAVILSAEGADYAPLIAEGEATFSDTILLAKDALSVPVGVTLATPLNARELLGAAEGYVSGVLPTPLGYEAFGEEYETAFFLGASEVTLSERTPLDSLTAIEGEKPFATLVSYSFSGNCGVIEGDLFRPKENGSGVLTVTNLYGVFETLTVIVDGFGGYEEGDGSEEHPYLIKDNAAFLRMLGEKNDKADVHYRLTSDLTALEVTESADFAGVLTAEGRTVEIDLAADALFASARGRIEGVNFLLHKPAVTASEVGGVFARRADSLTLRGAAITLDCPAVTLSDDTTFGLLIGVAENATRLVGLTVDVGACEIAAGENAAVGLLVGRGEDAYLRDVSVRGAVTLSGEGEILFGSVGDFTADSETAVEYDELTGDESVAYYAQNITLDLTLVATADTLKAGGVAGRCSALIKGVTGNVTLRAGGGELSLGGAVGETSGGVDDADLTVSLSTSDAAKGGSFGGIAGRADGAIRDSVLTLAAALSVSGRLYVGGVFGYGSEIENVKANTLIDAHSSGEESVLTALRELEGDAPLLIAAGGAAGIAWGRVSRVTVTIESLRAVSDVIGDDVWIAASGLASRLSYASDIAIGGGGSVEASGGRAIAAGVAALLGEGVDRAVISDVTLIAAERHAAIGDCYREDAWVTELYAALEGLTEEDSLVGTLSDGASVSRARYLSGGGVGEVGTGRVSDVSALGERSAFCSASLYAAFDAEVWNITGATLPSLK